MPVHDYRCEKCGAIIEDVLIKLSTTIPELVCPECGNAEEFEKTVSSGTYTKFNGDFETNDNRQGNKPWKDMDPTSVQGGGRVERVTARDTVLHKRDIGKKR